MKTTKERRQQLLGLGVPIEQYPKHQLPEYRQVAGEFDDGTEYIGWYETHDTTGGKRGNIAKKILQLEGYRQIPKVIRTQRHYLVDEDKNMIFTFYLPHRKYVK